MQRLSQIITLWLLLLTSSHAADIVTAQPGKPGVITVAASNTPINKRRNADFICNGTNDEATILLALAQLRGAGSVNLPGDNQTAAAAYGSQGGTIFFLSGEYNLQTTLTINITTATHNVRLDGEAGATLHVNNTDETPGIVFDGGTGTGLTYGLHRIEVFNLTFVGNFDELSPATAHCGDLVQLIEVAYPQVGNCHFLKSGRDGLHIDQLEEIAPQNRIITGNQFLACARHGLYIKDSHDLIVSNCQIEENARLAGSGGAGVYVDGLVGGTFTTVLSEDNESAFNPTAVDFKIVDSGITMIGCDCDLGGYEIDLRSGHNLKMSNCHATNDIVITGTNNNVTLEACDAATSISCVMTTPTQGTFTMSGGRTGTLSVDCGKVFCTNAKINGVFSGNMLELSFIGGYCTLGDFGQAVGFPQIQNCSFVGCTKLLVDSSGTAVLDAEDTLSVIACGFEPAYDYSFRGADNCKMIFQTGWDHIGGTITFERTTVAQNNLRLILNSHLRSPVIVCDEIDFITLGGIITGGSIAVTGADVATSITGMIATGAAAIGFTDCDGRGVMAGCTGAATVTITDCTLFVAAYFENNVNPAITVSRP